MMSLVTEWFSLFSFAKEGGIDCSFELGDSCGNWARGRVVDGRVTGLTTAFPDGDSFWRRRLIRAIAPVS